MSDLVPQPAHPALLDSASLDQPDPIRLIDPNEDLPLHPLAKLFPPMTADERAYLKESIIRTHGPLDPGSVVEGRLVIGQQGWEICKELGIPFPVREWASRGEDLLDFVKAKTIAGQHLTSSQRAVMALKAEEILAREAKERQRRHGGTAPGQASKNKGADAESDSQAGEAREQAAAEWNTNPRYISDAKRLRDENPDLLHRVFLGELSMEKAMSLHDGPRIQGGSKSAKDRKGSALTGPGIAKEVGRVHQTVQKLVKANRRPKVEKALKGLNATARKGFITRVQALITGLQTLLKAVEAKEELEAAPMENAVA